MSKKKKKRSISKGSLKSEILRVFRQFPKKSFNYKQLAKAITLNRDENYSLINIVLVELEKEEKLIEIGRGKFKFNPIKEVLLQGVVDVTTSGNAYVTVDNFEEDVFIHKKHVKNVVTGDTVSISIFSKYKKNKKEGEILEVLEHKTKRFVGIVEMGETSAFIIVQNLKVHFDIFLPKKECKNIKDGQKVVVEVQDWGYGKNSPSAIVIEVLGYPGEHNVEIHSILAEYNLPHNFDSELEDYAKSIPSEISKEEISKRRDFRNITTFTIDPYDAKDFDDALSIEEISKDIWEIGIHIADVSHYINDNDKIDLEAKERATSVYLVDRVVPMLPEILSNQLCSLRANEEKLCFSAVFQINNNGKITNEWFGKTVINSDHRFTYEDAQEIIETKEGKYSSELSILNNIAKILRKKRMKSGAFSFERLETKFNIDEDGNPLSIYFKTSKEAHKLIEEFMLLANRKVAEFIAKKNLPFVYRIHDSPDPEKLQTFNILLKKFGYHIQTENKNSISSSMNKLLKEVQGKDESNMIETLAIRTMAKAVYTTENIGHYGLAFNHYTHFTSPIRRYPDVMVHRLLFYYLNKGSASKSATIENQCKHSSEREIIASKAERASIKYMQAKYMSSKIGEMFDGIVSGVTDFGIFVEVHNTGCEGLIRMRDIPGDFYTFKEADYCVQGHNTKKRYYLGDKLKVKIKNVNLERKEIDLVILI
jgi:ribonuclease R